MTTIPDEEFISNGKPLPKLLNKYKWYLLFGKTFQHIPERASYQLRFARLHVGIVINLPAFCKPDHDWYIPIPWMKKDHWCALRVDTKHPDGKPMAKGYRMLKFTLIVTD